MLHSIMRPPGGHGVYGIVLEGVSEYLSLAAEPSPAAADCAMPGAEQEGREHNRENCSPSWTGYVAPPARPTRAILRFQVKVPKPIPHIPTPHFGTHPDSNKAAA